MRVIYHRLIGELFGHLSGWTLLKCARHAQAMGDYVTVLRCREIARRGVEVGWDATAFDNGDLVPGRTHEDALRLLGLKS